MEQRYWFRFALVGALAMGLGGCQSLRSTFGLDQPPPNEFIVPPEASLLMPPAFNLRPPQPGAPNAHAIRPRNEAQAALLGQANGGTSGTSGAASDPGLAALLNMTGAANSNPAIRQTVDAASQHLTAQRRSFVSRLLFWQTPPPSGTALNAKQEAQRLRNEQASGEPVNRGQIPIIKRRQRGWLGGIF